MSDNLHTILHTDALAVHKFKKSFWTVIHYYTVINGIPTGAPLEHQQEEVKHETAAQS